MEVIKPLGIEHCYDTVTIELISLCQLVGYPNLEVVVVVVVASC